MIKANHKRIAHFLFGWYLGSILRKDFSGMHWYREGLQEEKAWLVLGNHFSWWDGFILYQFNRAIVQKKYYLMMLEEELHKRMFFSYLGAFSIKKGDRSVVQSIDYAAELLKAPHNMVVIFPQGRIQSMHLDEPAWQPGIGRIIANGGNDFQTVFSCALPDYMASRKPVLHVYLEGQEKNISEPNALEAAYQNFYKRCKARQAQMSV